MSSVVVTLGTLTIGNDVADANGATWYLSAIEGWDSPELRMTLNGLPGEDRQTIGPVLYNARAISLIGDCRTPTEASAWLSKAKLMSATELTRAAGTLTLTETTTKRISVYRAGRVLWKPWHSLLGFDYEIPLIAPDPRILENLDTTINPTAATANNTGNYKATPTLRVVGAAAGPMVITNTTVGKSVTITGGLTAGQTLDVDFKARTVLINGVNSYNLVSPTPQWFDLAPGNNSITYSGGGTPTLTWNSSWI